MPFWFYHKGFNREIITASRQQATQQLDHISWLIEDKSFQSVEELHQWLSVVGRQLNSRLTYIGTDGRALADSHFTMDEVNKFESLAHRPEFAQAMSGETGSAIRISKVSEQEYIFAAKKINLKQPLSPGVIRIALPFSPVKSQLDRAANGFVFLLTIIFIATFLISWALVRRLRIPVSEMTSAVTAIGAGDYSRRIPGQDRELYPLALAINRMADTLGRRLQKISDRQQHLDAVFDGMQEGVMVLSPKGKIIEVNRAFRELVSPGTTCIGKNPLEVVRNLELQDASDRILSRANLEQSTAAIEVPLGRDRVFSVDIVRAEGQTKDMGAIVVFHEISKIKRLEKIRQDFVSNVSRELNAPLVSIKAHVEKILAGTSIAEKTRDSLRAVLKETSDLLSIVEDLLQLAALDSSPVQHALLSANPAQALDMAWDQCRAAAVARNVELEVDLPPLGIDVATNLDQLARVFRNLLGNGIKYSPEGGRLSVGHCFEGEMVIFSVQDEGPGIPPRQQDRIFERFYRTGKQVAGVHASSGLGLAICKHIVQNHRGTIWVQSPNTGRKNGATFLFSMPRAGKESMMEERPQESALH
ncbi:MAG: ATP-binding protein [Syntrophobacteraceae bacterium]